MHTDWTGLAVFVTAVSGFVVSVGTLGLQVVTVIKQASIHKQINGRMDNLIDTTAKKSYTEGKIDALNGTTEHAPDVKTPAG